VRIKSVPFLIVDILGKVVSGIQNSAIIKGAENRMVHLSQQI